MKKPAGLTDNLRGILLLVASVTCFGVVDGISKMLIDTQSFGQVMLARYVLALPSCCWPRRRASGKTCFTPGWCFCRLSGASFRL